MVHCQSSGVVGGEVRRGHEGPCASCHLSLGAQAPLIASEPLPNVTEELPTQHTGGQVTPGEDAGGNFAADLPVFLEGRVPSAMTEGGLCVPSASRFDAATELWGRAGTLCGQGPAAPGSKVLR
jgi:hypothetical protein